MVEYPFPGVEDAYLFKVRFCPNRCGEQLQGKAIERHLQSCCPLRQALCTEGCGRRMLGRDLEGHAKTCTMTMLLERAEVAVRESALKELRLTLDELHGERRLALARLSARGEEPASRDWASRKCEVRARKVEEAGHELVKRLRRRAEGMLTDALARIGSDADPRKGVSGSALKYWDGFHTEVGLRGSRPWDLQTPVVEPLRMALLAAAECGADLQMRARGEAAMLQVLRRLLQNLLDWPEAQECDMAETLEGAATALRAVELQDPSGVHQVLEQVHAKVHRAALRELPQTPLEFHDVVADGDMEMCAWYLDRQQANPSALDPKTGLPPLVTAARAGDLAVCRLLLEHGADVDGRGAPDGCSALHWAAHQRSTRVASMLLEGRANPRLQDKRGQDALMKLVRRDFDGPAAGCAWTWEVLQEQRLMGPELRSVDVSDIESAMVAAEADADCVGFSIGRPARGGEPRLSFHGRAQAGLARGPEDSDNDEASVWTSYLKIEADVAHDVQALIVAGADAGAVDASGFTALHHHLVSAPGRGSGPVVAALLRAGADVNRRDRSARATTPLLLAVSARRADLVERMLRDAWPPADVDTRAADGTSALALAESLGASKVAQLLRGAGASAWADAEVVLGKRTTFSFDTRAPPVPA